MALDMGIQMVDALKQLHEIGYIHNDIKLDNICYEPIGGTDRYKYRLIDFGLSSKYIKDG